MIYIATDIHGRGVKHVTAFKNRADFHNYASDVLACSYETVLVKDTINDLCDKLYDSGIGFGARNHKRVSRNDAKHLIRNGAEDIGCYNL